MARVALVGPVGAVSSRAPKVGGMNQSGSGLSHLKVAPSDNGGFSVEHHFQNGMTPPKSFTFGSGQGQQMLDHVAKAMKVRPPAMPKQ